MKELIITVIGDNDDVVSMINYTICKGLTKANYTDYIMFNTEVPPFLKRRIIDFRDTKKDLFRTLFAIDDEVSDNDWYDFQKHDCIKDKEILLQNERIYDNQLFNLNDIGRKLGFPINFPIIKVSELQKVYERSINELYGNVFLYHFIKTANDIAFSTGVCILKGVIDVDDIRQIKQSFPLRGSIINLVDFDYHSDYKIEKELLLKENRFKLFYKIQTLLKFILL